MSSSAVAPEQVRKTPFAGSDRRDLRSKVAHGELRQAAVGANDRSDFLILQAWFEDLHERHLQPFGKNIPCNGAEHAANVLPMAHRRREGDQFAVVEDRQSEDHMIQVAAHHLSIIGERDLQLLDILFAPVAKLRLDRIREAADDISESKANGNGVTVGVEQPDGEVLRLVIRSSSL